MAEQNLKRRVAEAALMDEDAVRRIAHIVGESSAAALALRELERRRAEGQDVAIYRLGRSWLVGPRVADGVALPDGSRTDQPSEGSDA